MHRILTAVALLAAIVLAVPAAASAHGDEGEVTLTRAVQTGATSVAIEVGIVYEGDEHLAEDAAVTATLTGADGTVVGPVALERTGESTSLYGATIDVPSPGEWAVSVTSERPSGGVEGSVTVTADAPAGVGDPADPDGTSSTAPPGTTDVAPQSVTPVDEVDADRDALEDDGLSPGVVLAACLALAVVVIGGAFVVANRRAAADRAAGAPGTPGDEPADSEPADGD